MHCLAGTFVKEITEEECPETHRMLYPVKIVLPPNKSRILYFPSQAKQKEWMSMLLKAMGFANLFDFYELGKTLGKGQFGLVKLATHKVTGVQAAIKTVKKANMKPIEVFQQRREIEVLKMCQHDNIIKLVDLFENSDKYFIVLDFMQGKDLFDYIQKRGFSLPEQRVQDLAYQVAMGVQYMHEFGIVHRDLKLENIMMSDSSDSAMPKIVDFGLAKIIGPSNTASEPFGTLGYVAPEVLKKQPYTFSCDVWSLGCIIYALLSGSLPFDHESQKETIRMTLDDKLVFDLPCWDTVSP
jgi:calcium-dependent protein kinase